MAVEVFLENRVTLLRHQIIQVLESESWNWRYVKYFLLQVAMKTDLSIIG